ncbi:MAG TPA: MoaD/ThiS family protein [Acidimicrobiia bacterium]|nr:MoaD/ThiS family protein [Acidimicrobiia bacterium]
MKVILRNPSREVELSGARRVGEVLRRLQLTQEGVLVIRNGELLTVDEEVGEEDVLEMRPVISGG